MAPDDNSTPLQTISYWKAVMPRMVSRSLGSSDKNFSRGKFGMEKGLGEKSMRFSSSFHSYMGKSTIQQNSKTSFLVSPNSLPIFNRAWPASDAARAALSAAKNTASPALLAVFVANWAMASGERN